MTEDKVAILMVPDINRHETQMLADAIIKASEQIMDDLGYHLIILNKELYTISLDDFKKLIERFYSEFIEKRRRR